MLQQRPSLLTWILDLQNTILQEMKYQSFDYLSNQLSYLIMSGSFHLGRRPRQGSTVVQEHLPGITPAVVPDAEWGI